MSVVAYVLTRGEVDPIATEATESQLRIRGYGRRGKSWFVATADNETALAVCGHLARLDQCRNLKFEVREGKMEVKRS